MLSEETTLIYDLSNNTVVPNHQIFDESSNFNTWNNLTNEEETWKNPIFEENLDWILSWDPNPIDTPENDTFINQTLPPFETTFDTTLPTLIFSHDTCQIESSLTISNLPQKTRLNSTMESESDTESSSTDSGTESGTDLDWIPTLASVEKTNFKNHRIKSSQSGSRKNSSNERKQKEKKPNVSHWLWGLLQNPINRNIIQFDNEKDGEFRVMDQKGLANLWAHRNGRTNGKIISYKDLARTMRYHYKQSKGKELQAVNKHLVYRFSRHFLNARRNEIV